MMNTRTNISILEDSVVHGVGRLPTLNARAWPPAHGDIGLVPVHGKMPVTAYRPTVSVTRNAEVRKWRLI